MWSGLRGQQRGGDPLRPRGGGRPGFAEVLTMAPSKSSRNCSASAAWSARPAAAISALLSFGVWNALRALAPTYPAVLTTRVVAAVGAALYTRARRRRRPSSPARRWPGHRDRDAGDHLVPRAGHTAGHRPRAVHRRQRSTRRAPAAGVRLRRYGGQSAGRSAADRFGPRRVVVVALLLLTVVLAALPALKRSLPAAALVMAVTGRAS